jgi:polyhydroxyalkanoate synthesis regulator phasin
MLKRRALTAATLALAAASAFAQTAAAPTATPRVDQRQANQERRIDQGVASGELNTRETRRLTKEQHAIDRAENHAKADGTVTQTERRRLRKMQKHAGQHIHQQKHDAQTARP